MQDCICAFLEITSYEQQTFQPFMALFGSTDAENWSWKQTRCLEIMSDMTSATCVGCGCVAIRHEIKSRDFNSTQLTVEVLPLPAHTASILHDSN